ncbi:MAG TPA: hypothetical protein VGX25_24910 [Actinophytocola sp.]|uniref:hypothetical protein n=1 Tax=Actinophytocola sp. TaxID=1872138 RepID=UPI002DDCC7BF|nr:hypothetical protein [Actinophytocola sp.]HEV2782645.1 hypothetical protein [Actinophytocola sp.]
MRTARPRGVYGANYGAIFRTIPTMQHQVLAQHRNPAGAAAGASATIKPRLTG